MQEEEIQAMSLEEYENYEKDRMARNAWYASEEVSGRIDDAPVFKEYIQSRVSESTDKMYIFILITCRFFETVYKRTKWKCLVRRTLTVLNVLWTLTIFAGSCS